MTMQITCPQCQASYTVPEEQAGKRVKCKKCERDFTASAPEPKEDLPTAKALPAKKPERAEPREEDQVTRRKSAPAREAARSRRRDRYDDDEEDYRPRQRTPAKRGFSALALILVIGGIFGSLLIIV